MPHLPPNGAYAMSDLSPHHEFLFSVLSNIRILMFSLLKRRHKVLCSGTGKSIPINSNIDSKKPSVCPPAKLNKVARVAISLAGDIAIGVGCSPKSSFILIEPLFYHFLTQPKCETAPGL